MKLFSEKGDGSASLHLLPEYHKALLNLVSNYVSVRLPVSSHILFVDICIVTGYFQSLQIKIKGIFHYIVTSCKCTSIQIRWTVAIKKSDVFVVCQRYCKYNTIIKSNIDQTGGKSILPCSCCKSYCF